MGLVRYRGFPLNACIQSEMSYWTDTAPVARRCRSTRRAGERNAVVSTPLLVAGGELRRCFVTARVSLFAALEVPRIFRIALALVMRVLGICA